MIVKLLFPMAVGIRLIPKQKGSGNCMFFKKVSFWFPQSKYKHVVLSGDFKLM